MTITWLIETDVSEAAMKGLAESATRAGHRVVKWHDDFLTRPPKLDGKVLFHGSLANAAHCHARAEWSPGAFCAVQNFECSAWYDGAKTFLLHEKWEILSASEFVANAASVAARIGAAESVFVRPCSPLKPFSGRVVAVEGLTLAHLDHGFYYDDAEIPIVVAPVQVVEDEHRFVVVGNDVVAGCGYLADGRTASAEAVDAGAEDFARKVAHTISPPEKVYVLDVARTSRGWRLVELNPFSGADLYGCDPDAVVKALSTLVI